jgi:hypothetical protein
VSVLGKNKYIFVTSLRLLFIYFLLLGADGTHISLTFMRTYLKYSSCSSIHSEDPKYSNLAIYLLAAMSRNSILQLVLNPPLFSLHIQKSGHIRAF